MDVQDRQDGWEYASVGRRLMAGLLDWVVAFGIGVVGAALVQVVWAFFELGSFERNLVSGITIWSIPALLLTAALAQAAFGLLVSSQCYTAGHGLMGLRVMKPDGTRIGLGRSLARQIVGSPLLVVYLLPLSILMVAWVVIIQRANEYMPLTWIGDPVRSVTQHWWVWGLVGSLVLIAINHAMMKLDAVGQGWHDKIAGVVVVKKEYVKSGYRR